MARLGGGPRARNGRLSEAAEIGLVALGAAVLVLLGFLLLTRGPTLSIGALLSRGASTGGPNATVDLPVERVIRNLPDGRVAMGTFTLRMREDATPRDLRIAAAATVTPIPDEVQPGPPRPEPRARLGSNEALIREKVGAAMSGLPYSSIAGEEGKERLRLAVRDAVNQALPQAPVTQVFVREYIVQ